MDTDSKSLEKLARPAAESEKISDEHEVPWSYDSRSDLLTFSVDKMSDLALYWTGSREPFARRLSNHKPVAILPGLNLVYGRQKSGKSAFLRDFAKSYTGLKTVATLGEPLEEVDFSRPNLRVLSHVSDVYELIRKGYKARMADSRHREAVHLIIVDSLRSYLFTAKGTAGSLGVSNQALTTGLTQLHNAAVTVGAAVYVSVNPVHTSERGFLENLEGALEGSIRSYITIEKGIDSFKQSLRQYPDFFASLDERDKEVFRTSRYDVIDYSDDIFNQDEEDI